MVLTQFLSPENIHHNVMVSSKKRLLEFIGKIASDAFQKQYHDHVCPVECFSSLFKREKLGCTYINNGIALPHAKLAVNSEIEIKPIAIFLKLEQPIDYEVNDNKEVDLVYALLFPEGTCAQYKEMFQAIVHKLNDKNLAKQLRATQSADEIWQILEYTDKQVNEEID